MVFRCCGTMVLIGLFIVMGFGYLIKNDEARAAKYQRDKAEIESKKYLEDVDNIDNQEFQLVNK